MKLLKVECALYEKCLCSHVVFFFCLNYSFFDDKCFILVLPSCENLFPKNSYPYFKEKNGGKK